jgi:hypothetical protein
MAVSKKGAAGAGGGVKFPKREQRITSKQAAELTKRYQKYAEPTGEKCGTFGGELVMKLLSQKGCTALRFYHGRHEDGRYALVLVGVDAEGRDMTDGILIDDHWPCPPFCPPDSLLNS